MKAQVDRVEEIDMDLLEIGASQVRTKNVEKGIEELAESISAMGLLEPIVVCPTEDGERYEILTGQRRFFAHEHLGKKVIRACILKDRVSSEVATAISLTENMMRRDISSVEYVNACTELYRKYGSIKAVSDELGLPTSKVTEYVKYEALTPQVKEMFDKGELNLKDHLKTALRAQKVAMDKAGNIDTDKAVQFTKEMTNLSGLQQEILEKAASENPSATAEEIIETGREQPPKKRITATIGMNEFDALGKYAGDEGTDESDAAAGLIRGGLGDKGYL